eukprot:TRINITY_DN727_c0_g1_i1.p1 TRINITY_DN727_c0_g1~~TRINITY_DN727_c0_g1_i1.p1  ORF type:complete len:218 (-),score=48.21 TRINITY_DN727_c0_g1_i1:17-628(-)
METPKNDWNQFFIQYGIERKSVPFGLPPVEIAKSQQIKECSEELSFVFPTDYENFALQIGPGTLGRCRIYCPTASYSVPDLRFQTSLLKTHFSDPDLASKLVFPIHDSIVFAQDIHENYLFVWLREAAAKGDYTIYCLDRSNALKVKPPRVAKTFLQFVEKVCLGRLIQDLGLSNDDDEDEDEDDSDNEKGLPPKTFKPFAAQ